MSDLDEILKGTEQAEPEATEAVAESTDEAETEAATEEPQATGEKEAEQATADTSPVSQDNENTEAALKAELARIRQQNRELKGRLEKPAEQAKPDFFADPDAALSQLQHEIQNVAQKTRIDTSEMIAKANHPDYDEKIEVFQQMALENKALWAEMAGQVNPAEWAYKQAVNKLEMAEIGDISSFKEKLIAQAKAEAKAEFEKEQEKRIEAEIAKRTGLPKSLSDARSVGNNADADEDDLKTIIGR